MTTLAKRSAWSPASFGNASLSLCGGRMRRSCCIVLPGLIARRGTFPTSCARAPTARLLGCPRAWGAWFACGCARSGARLLPLRVGLLSVAPCFSGAAFPAASWASWLGGPRSARGGGSPGAACCLRVWPCAVGGGSSWGAARVPVLALACVLVRLALWLCWSGWVGLGCARAPFGLSLGGAAPFCGAPSHPVPLGWRSCLRCLFHLLVPFCFTSVGRLVSRFSQFGASVDDRASSWTS